MDIFNFYMSFEVRLVTAFFSSYVAMYVKTSVHCQLTVRRRNLN